MALKDLIPWNRGRDVTVRQAEAPSPFLSLQREMNRLFDEASVAALRARGYRVRHLEDGFPEWKAAGLPVEAA